MLLAIAPGFLSVMPGIELSGVLAVVPLVNIVLLARDVLQGNINPLVAGAAVVSTALYGVASLALAARVFGSDAILYGSQGSWADLFRRPDEPAPSRPQRGGPPPRCLPCKNVERPARSARLRCRWRSLSVRGLAFYLVVPLGIAGCSL
jgi:hypothetical protein